MANTLERLVNLQEEMAANFNNFLTVQRTRRKRKSKRAKLVTNADEIIYFQSL